MLETLFEVESTLGRHRNAPLLAEREAFLKHRQEQGTSRYALRHLSSALLNITIGLQLEALREIDMQEIGEAARRWAEIQQCSPRVRTYIHCVNYFTFTARRWLLFLGKLKVPIVPRARFSEQVDDFARYMTEEQGLLVSDISPDLLRDFLHHLEEERKCSISTRNQRLAAIRALARFVGERNPECLEWCGRIRTVPFKRSTHRPVSYLEKNEMDALLKAPDKATWIGRRDYGLLLFMYNSGARADEVAQLGVGDLNLRTGGENALSSVRLTGKGNKTRICPLWASTTAELRRLITGRKDDDRVFLNRCSAPFTRFGVHDIVTRYARRTAKCVPEMQSRRIGPHTIRHTTATHLLRAGVDINTIRAWLGHVSIETTNIYAETDLEMKAKALGMCEMKHQTQRERWRDNPDLLTFLASL